MVKHFILIAFGAGLLACSSVDRILVDSADSSNSDVLDQGVEYNAIDSIVAPYKEHLEAEMNQVIAVAEKDFLKDRPSGSLNNWSADALLTHQTRGARLSAPTFTLLNVGGLRNTINQGEVTLSDIFKVMPFDNEVVWVEMPIASLEKIAAYLTTSGGEPIGGAVLKDGKLVVNGVDESTEKVWIITSDYLMNGGDKMTFFLDKLSVTHTNVLLRDAFIEEAKFQKTLIWNDENRIHL